ncbi:hypothetical protein EBZ80_03445 [bacterium]|nr:hypothetical protein [bacterium]
MSSSIFLGVFLPEQTLRDGCLKAIELALADYPSNRLIVRYYPTTLVGEVPAQADRFLADSAGNVGYRAALTASSSLMLAFDTYLNRPPRSLGVIVLDVNASADALSDLLTPDALTYGYFNRYLVSSFYQIFASYTMRRVLVYYDPDPARYALYQEDLLRQLEEQAALLSVPFEKRVLGSPPKTVCPRTATYIICTAARLETLFVSSGFVGQFRQECWIMMGDITQNLRNIFSPVPAWVAIPWPLDFTATSSSVYLRTGQTPGSSTYEIYPTYQIVYSLAVCSADETVYLEPFTLSVYLGINSFENVPPPWVYANSFSQERRGLLYGLSVSVFSANVLYEGYEALYLEHYVSGTPQLTESTSVFVTTGYTPFYPAGYWYNENTAWYIYDGCDRLLRVRNSADVTGFGDGTLTQNGLQETTFVYTTDAEGRFTALAALVDAKRIRCVSPTMSVRKRKQIFYGKK